MTKRSLFYAASSLFALTAAFGAPAIAAADNTPSQLRHAHDLGLSDQSKSIDIVLHMTPTNPALFKATVDALYDPASPIFHKWLTDADLQQFAPSPQEVSAVRAELEQHGLVIVSVQQNGFSLRARGALRDVAAAFNTQIHDFDRNGQTFRANVSNARLSGVAASYVSSVSGLESHTVHPMIVRATNLLTGKPYASIPTKSVEAGGFGKLITDQSLSPVQTFDYTTPGAALPTATYTGVVYDAPGSLTPSFTPRQLQHVYGLDQAYKQGLDGTGQTIVLLEAYGYPTMEADANTFAKLSGLPPFTSANLRVVYPQGRPANPQIGVIVGWNVEIALDVQWAHAMAPGAKILVVASNGQDSVDFQAAMQSIIDNHLGYTVSDSWEEDTDLFAGPSEQESFENILTLAAAKGISFQFSTGDSGDSGLGTPLGAAGVPSAAPHAVAVGGTTILNNVGGKGYLTTAWGEGDVIIDDVGVIDPPVIRSIPGGGGGESVFWPKPAWQSALPGTGRQTPDISALSNPFTGVPIVVTDPSTKQQTVIPGVGGTSLASPIFTAVWAIAQQKAGHALGQASPTLAGMKSGVADVLPVSSQGDIKGTITDANGTTSYTAKALFKGLYNHQQNFVATIYPLPQESAAISLGFGLDTSFTVTPGWDNATGYGTIDGLNFIDGAAAYGGK